MNIYYDIIQLKNFCGTFKYIISIIISQIQFPWIGQIFSDKYPLDKVHTTVFFLVGGGAQRGVQETFLKYYMVILSVSGSLPDPESQVPTKQVVILLSLLLSSLSIPHYLCRFPSSAPTLTLTNASCTYYGVWRAHEQGRGQFLCTGRGRSRSQLGTVCPCTLVYHTPYAYGRYKPRTDRPTLWE